MNNIYIEFYKCFGLKPKYYYECFYNGKNGKFYVHFVDKKECAKWVKKAKNDYGKDNAGVEKVFKDYYVSDENCLKLLQILTEHQRFYCIPECSTLSDLKQYVLERSIKTAERLTLSSVFAEKVYKLFGGK